jgi:chemotaxis protein histidine kinase CheA
VTEIRRLTLASKSHDEQMTIIAQILANNDHVFEHFIQEAEALLDDCLTLISMPAKRALDEVPVLKINLHTFKGMAHSVNFEAMTQAAHQLEQQLVRWDGTEEAQSILLRHTHELRAMVDHFSDIARTQLGRKLDHSVVQLPAQMVHDWLQNWSDENVHQNLVAISTESLHGIIQGLNRDLKALAPMLGKDVPDIVIEGADERMELRIASKFRHCLLHIVRNALDHGIEPSAERIAQKKKPQGTIRFQIERQQRIVVLTISDDGRGLNLTRIKEKMSHKEATSSPSLETIASWIFLDGVSTANRISHISGRGVGMGAMKHFIEGIGGSIAVSLLSEQTNGYHSFALRITLQHDVLEQPIRIAG